MKSEYVGIRPIHIRRICTKLIGEGHSLETLLCEARLPKQRLREGDGLLGVDEVRRFIAACQRVSARPTLALECGWETPLTDLGLLGLQISWAENLREAMRTVQAYLIQSSTPLKEILLEADGGLWVLIAPRRPLGDIQAFVQDFQAGIFGAVIAAVVPGPRERVRLEVPWSAPPWQALYQRMADRVDFNAGRMAYWLPDELLDRPNPMASRAMFQAVSNLAQQEVCRLKRLGNLAMQLKALQQKPGQSWLGAADMARQLGVSRSTLGRHLKAQGKTYRQALEDQRRDRACWLLFHSADSIVEIARQLGYSSESNFSRAFRRWYATSPSAYRALGEGGSAAVQLNQD